MIHDPSVYTIDCKDIVFLEKLLFFYFRSS